MSTAAPASTPTVREARFQLARALISERSDHEPALALLREALDDPGEQPTDATIHDAMADAHLAFGDLGSAFAASLLCITDDPRGSRDAIGRARGLLDQYPRAAASQPPSLIDGLEAAIDGSGDAALWVLAGRVRLLRGEYERAMSLLERGGATLDLAAAQLAIGRPADALATLDAHAGEATPDEETYALVRARAHAESGDYAAALAAIPEGGSPDHAFVWALSMLGGGDASAALEMLPDPGASMDIRLLRIVALLAGARYEEARREASAAVAEDPFSADTMLLKAQVELEWSIDLDQARNVLRRAHEMRAGDLVESRWVVLQRPFSEGRDRFGYFLAEAGEVSGRDDVLALVSAVSRGSTSYQQDARLDLLRGATLEATGSAAEAARAYDEAAKNFEWATLSDQTPASVDRTLLVAGSRDAARRAFRLDPTAERAGLVARALWQGSFSGVTPAENLELLEEARQILEAGRYPESIEDAQSLLYYDGLVSRRLADLVSEGRLAMGWRAVEELMGAVLSDRDNAYRALYLSEALGVVDVWESALAFARVARELHQDDATKEALVIAEANARFDAATLLPLLEEGFENRDAYLPWTPGVRAFVSLVNGEPVSDSVQGTDSWARQVTAQVVALEGGPEAARRLLEALLEEYGKSPGDEVDGAYVALLLGDPVAAERVIAKGRNAGNASEPGASWYHALVGLVTGDEGRAAAARACVPRLSTRSVKQALHVQIPLLEAVYGTRASLDALREVIEAELQARSGGTPPSIYDGLDLAPVERRERIRVLAVAFDALRGQVPRTEALALLEGVSWEGRMARVVAGAKTSLEAPPEEP